MTSCSVFNDAYINQFAFQPDEILTDSFNVFVRSPDYDKHLAEIEAWRATISEKRQRQLKHPLSNVAAWRKATAQAKCADLHRAAALAWRRFVSCATALPPNEAVPLWQAAQAELATYCLSAPTTPAV